MLYTVRAPLRRRYNLVLSVVLLIDAVIRLISLGTLYTGLPGKLVRYLRAKEKPKTLNGEL